MGIVITGTGSYLPERVIDNHELEATTSDFDRERSGGTLDEWVTDRIGVSSRHRVARGEGSGSMAVAAGRRALDDAGVEPDDLDLIVLSTFTSDHRLPQSASHLQDALGTRAKCIQLDAACAGFVDGLAVASALMTQLGLTTALVVHSEVMSALCDPDKFLMQAIFGDGAGAVVLRHDPAETGGLLGLRTWTDGSVSGWLSAGGGILSPTTTEVPVDGSHYLDIDTRAIFPFAVEKMTEALEAVMADRGHGLDDVDWVIAHQTGVNITRAIAERTGIPEDKFLMTLSHTGNTSGATIPIALDQFNREGWLGPGAMVALPTVGAGMAWGAALVSWVETPAGRAARAALDELIELSAGEHVGHHAGHQLGHAGRRSASEPAVVA
ncbi:MAG: 3-oxoacyl-ACP synthase III family protein [Acidimicrobiales bacterium]